MTTNFAEATREALEFLRSKNHIGTIATIDASGQPYASPVHYAMGSEFDFYFLTAKGTHKSKNIDTNHKIAFSVGTGPDYICVMIRGTASIPNSEEQSGILAKMTESFDEHKDFKWPVRTLDDLRDKNLVMYKITPEKVTFLNINSAQEPKSSTDHLYHLMD